MKSHHEPTTKRTESELQFAKRMESRLRRPRQIILALALGSMIALVSPIATGAEPTVHVVYSGQRLGSIAKRYNVTVEAICNANGIRATEPIRPGQRLHIPGKEDRDGSSTREWAERQHAAKSQASVGAPPSSSPREHTKTPSPAPSPKRPPRVAAASTEPLQHAVNAGETLGKIAARYHVSIDALCTASGIVRKDPIRVGQVLVVPGPGDPDGSVAAKLRKSGALSLRLPAGSTIGTKRGGKPSWSPYRKPPWRRGFITLRSYRETWSGYVTGRQGEVLPAAHQAICRLMGADGDHPRVDRRLVQVLVKVSDTFGGRSIRVVSGYRTESYALNSRHRRSQAIDFSIPGVPNEALRDYLLTFDRVGVGYYPNSSFVHLDVRPHKTYWVDLSGPGEAPRYLR